jgi:hypothetical protein
MSIQYSMGLCREASVKRNLPQANVKRRNMPEASVKRGGKLGASEIGKRRVERGSLSNLRYTASLRLRVSDSETNLKFVYIFN